MVSTFLQLDTGVKRFAGNLEQMHCTLIEINQAASATLAEGETLQNLNALCADISHYCKQLPTDDRPSSSS